jgi:nitrous oxidase accessory protein NosD
MLKTWRSSAWTTPIVSVLAILTAGVPNRASAATLAVGPGQPYRTPSAAAAAAHDGDHITIAAGTYHDCSVWKANNLTIEGAGPAATVITGTPCGGKALFITQGNEITIRNLALQGAHVADFNGAGIRAEGGDLTIEHVRFADDEDGILTAPGPARLVIRDSDFIGDGSCAGSGGCAHGVYAGHIALLRIEHSRFVGTRIGHHIKSRAQRTEVIGCDLRDGADGTASFAVDVPNGGALLLRDTYIEKGPHADNHTAAVMIGEEGVTQPTPGITIDHNTFRVDGDYRSYLVDNKTTTPAELTGNILQGNALPLSGNGSVVPPRPAASLR